MIAATRREAVPVLLLGAALLGLSAPAAQAENSAISRDCSLVATPGASVDADLVLIAGQTLRLENGGLVVSPQQNSLTLTASESTDNGDHAGHVTLTATIASPGTASQTVSGSGVGFAMLALPLNGSGVGRTYTISWSATFDNGQHLCPSAITPSNTTPIPFVVTVGQS